MKRSLLAMAAAGLLAATTTQVAQAQSSAATERAAPVLEEASGQWEGMSGEWILGIIIVAAAGIGLYFILDGDDDQVSP